MLRSGCVPTRVRGYTSGQLWTFFQRELLYGPLELRIRKREMVEMPTELLHWTTKAKCTALKRLQERRITYSFSSFPSTHELPEQPFKGLSILQYITKYLLPKHWFINIRIILHTKSQRINQLLEAG